MWFSVHFSLFSQQWRSRFSFSVSHAKKREKDFVPAVAASKPTHTHHKIHQIVFFQNIPKYKDRSFSTLSLILIFCFIGRIYR